MLKCYETIGREGVVTCLKSGCTIYTVWLGIVRPKPKKRKSSINQEMFGISYIT